MESKEKDLKKRPMTLEEATTLLKKLGEWESVWRLDRETILAWAEHLKKINAK
jgi:hypothetical protein